MNESMHFIDVSTETSLPVTPLHHQPRVRFFDACFVFIIILAFYIGISKAAMINIVLWKYLWTSAFIIFKLQIIQIPRQS